MSEAAEQLEAMAAEAQMNKGNATDLIRKIETHTSGYEGGIRKETELSIYTAKECSANQLHHGSPQPLHPTSIKLESDCISEP